MWIGWDALSAGQLAELDAHEFEEFVRELIDIEARDRWASGGVTIEGPSPPYVADGDRDLIVRAHAAAMVSSDAYTRRFGLRRSLIGDLAAGESAVFTVKTGPTWQRSLRDDADSGGARVLPVLKAGGALVVVTREPLPSAPPKPRKTAPSKPTKSGKTAAPAKAIDAAADRPERDALREDLAARYARRVALGGMTASTLAAKIAIEAADDVALYLRRRRPIELRGSLLTTLGVRRSGALFDLDRWASEHQRDRSRPAFQLDPLREASIAQLGGSLSTAASGRPIVMIGPPGVGKTRVVIEALEGADATARVAVGEDVEDVIRALSIENLLRSAPTVVLIVDDCPIHKVDQIIDRFQRAQADEPGATQARLVVIVPHGDIPLAAEISKPHDLIRLTPLDREARRALIRAEVGDDDKVDAVDRSTVGYPWFAVLVAREVRQGAATPPTPKDAARLALASRDLRTSDAGSVKRHARALLAVMLADSPRWADLSEEEQGRLALAVDLRDRHELMHALRACIERGVLRALRRWYITPGILEREVWRLATEEPDPSGPLQARIRIHCPDRLSPFLTRLAGLGLSPTELALAASPIAAWVAASLCTITDLQRPELATSLTFCARYAPDAVAPGVARVLDETPAVELARLTLLRRPLVDALSALARAEGLFSVIEPALFKLRIVENEAFGNNASAVWEWQFLPWADLSDAPWSVRFETLTRRCYDGAQPARVSAVQGVASVLGGALLIGGPEPRPVPVAEVRARTSACWGLLIDVSRDADAIVAEAAQGAIVSGLRQAIAHGTIDPHADRLVEAVAGFAEPSRVEIRREIDIERVMAQSSPSHPLWARLDVITRASRFAQRLRERLIADGGAAFVDEEEARRLDDAVLNEGLDASAQQLIAHLVEFERPEAHRAGALMTRAGELDAQGTLGGALAARAVASADAFLVTTWGCGQWWAHRRERVLTLLDEWRDDPALASAAVELMARIGFDDVWLRDAAALIARGVVREPALRALEASRWGETSAETRRMLWSALLDRGDAYALRVALTRFDRMKQPLDPHERDLLERALRAMAARTFSGHVAWTFHRCGLRLLDDGREAAVSEAVVEASTHETLPGDGVWDLFEACAQRCPKALWRAMEPLLSTPTPPGGRLSLRLSFRTVVSRLPVETMMMWAGDVERRARTLASMLRFDEETLPALARALITNFGATSSVGRLLAARMFSTPRVVQSFADFYAARRAAVLSWAEEGGAVRAWALDVAEQLRREHEDEREDEGLARRGYGT